MGDVAFQEKAKARIRTLLERSQVVVLVSHDLKSLRELCTRGLWIQKGRLVDDGPVDLVIDRYLESTGSVAAAASFDSPITDEMIRCVSSLLDRAKSPLDWAAWPTTGIDRRTTRRHHSADRSRMRATGGRLNNGSRE